MTAPITLLLISAILLCGAAGLNRRASRMRLKAYRSLCRVKRQGLVIKTVMLLWDDRISSRSSSQSKSARPA